MSLYRKKLTLESINEQIAYWQEMRDIWARCDVLPWDDEATIVFKLYFRLQNVEHVLKECKRLQIGDFKASKDVTLFLQKVAIEDHQLMQRVKECQKANIQGAMKRH